MAMDSHLKVTQESHKNMEGTGIKCVLGANALTLGKGMQ